MKKHIVIDARESGTSTGRYIDKLVENLHELKPNYKITLLAKKHRVEFLDKIAPKFIVKTTRFKEFTFGEQLGLLKQIRSLKPDLVFFPAVQQPILYRGKVVTTVQDLTTIRFRNPSKNWIIFTVKRWAYILVNKIVGSKSVHIITPTEFVKDDFARFAHVNSRKITVTYESADKIPDKAEPIEELIDKLDSEKENMNDQLNSKLNQFTLAVKDIRDRKTKLSKDKNNNQYNYMRSIKILSDEIEQLYFLILDFFAGIQMKTALLYQLSENFNTINWTDPQKANYLINKGLRMSDNNPDETELLIILQELIKLMPYETQSKLLKQN